MRKRSELDSSQECVPYDESNATLASSAEDFDVDEDSDPDAREDFDLSTKEDDDEDYDDEDDEDPDIGEEFGSNADGNVWDLERLWKYAEEKILQVLSNVYEENKRNLDEAKRREEVALREARTKVRRLGLHSRLMTEVMVVHLTPYSAWFLDVGGLCELTGN